VIACAYLASAEIIKVFAGCYLHRG